MSASLIQYGIAHGWIKPAPPPPIISVDRELKRAKIREAMRRLRAKRYAQGLNALGQKRQRLESRKVMVDNLKRAWAEEFG